MKRKISTLPRGLELNRKNLQMALVYFIANVNLPFSVVEMKLFMDLLHLINKQAGPMINQISRQRISNHLSQVFVQLQEKIKQEILSKQV
ncbi:uncharacterized protein VP01_4596g1 [Puccinia sorghi]|uniref:Uncharacterized protein n=1 Tax=Puccinia sorghi TaxID=27349 RepID=A0A0L6UNK2_9BASI|nr:uncharacterized protein VP01_4596g1 [Puccinia sorghi]